MYKTRIVIKVTTNKPLNLKQINELDKSVLCTINEELLDDDGEHYNCTDEYAIKSYETEEDCTIRCKTTIL